MYICIITRAYIYMDRCMCVCLSKYVYAPRRPDPASCESQICMHFWLLSKTRGGTLYSFVRTEHTLFRA